MRPTIAATIALCTAALATPAALAQLAEVTAAAQLDRAATNVTTEITADSFDRSLGTLRAVRVDASLTWDGAIFAENLAVNATATLHGHSQLNYQLSLGGPTGEVLSFYNTRYAAPENLLPFDNAVDFAGPSGDTQTFVQSWSRSLELTDAGSLAAFSEPGGVTFSVSAATSSFLRLSGNGTIGSSAYAAATVVITYFYDAAQPVSESSVIPTPGTAAAVGALGLLTGRRRRRG